MPGLMKLVDEAAEAEKQGKKLTFKQIGE